MGAIVSGNYHFQQPPVVKVGTDSDVKPWVSVYDEDGVEVTFWLPSMAALDKFQDDLAASADAKREQLGVVRQSGRGVQVPEGAAPTDAGRPVAVVEVGWQFTYTDAPDAYDGFGTRTVDHAIGKAGNKTVRLVTTPDEHVNWQRQRYGSGSHLAAAQDEWAGLVAGDRIGYFKDA
jgi:hypothetical protein